MQTERGNSRGEQNEMAAVFTHFLTQKYTARSVSHFGVTSKVHKIMVLKVASWALKASDIPSVKDSLNLCHSNCGLRILPKDHPGRVRAVRDGRHGVRAFAVAPRVRHRERRRLRQQRRLNFPATLLRDDGAGRRCRV